MLVRPGSGLPMLSKVLRPMISGLPSVMRLKMGEIRRQPPRDGIAGADDAVLGHRGDQRDRHAHGAPSLASASPSTRTLVHSSCMTPPCDL